MNLRKEFWKYKHCYLWISPFFILFSVFSLYPAIYGLFISLTDYTGFEPGNFIGLKNYGRMINDGIFWESLWNTGVLWVYIVPIRTFLALAIAAALNSKRLLGRKVYSVVVLLPYVTAVVVASVVFRFMLSTNGGMVNVLLSQFGIPPVPWLESTAFSKVSVAIMNVWRMSGYLSLVFLSGMQKISSSVNEAAEIDGASSFQRFIKINIPLLRQEIFFVLLMSTIWLFQNVGDVMILTRGGPLNSSTNLVLYIYNNAYNFSKMGYASAMSYVLFAILLALSWLSVRYNYRGEEK